MKGSFVEFMKNQEHVCVKLMSVVIVCGLFFIEYRGEWSSLPEGARTEHCQRMRRHVDSFSLDRYAHDRHLAFDMIRCLQTLPDETMMPLIYEFVVPSLEEKGVLSTKFPNVSQANDESS